MKKILGLITALSITLSGCSSSKEPVTDYDFLLNTIAQITIYEEESDLSPEEIIDGCFSLCRDYENMLSKTIEGSDIYKINHSNGTPVEVEHETADLIQKAIDYSILSGGMFDITTAYASELWNFTGEEHHVPTEEELKTAVSKTGYENIKIDGNMVTLTGDVTEIDLGGIGKGYVGDKAREYLVENGVTKAIINLGGNILTIQPEDGDYFSIGVQEPFGEQNALYGTVAIKNKTVVTSGIYERCFEENGKLYHHILNPFTASPVENDLYSVTIIADSSVDADALSTTCFALGVEKGLELINSIDNTEAIFITNDLEYHASNGIGKDIEFKLYEK